MVTIKLYNGFRTSPSNPSPTSVVQGESYVISNGYSALAGQSHTLKNDTPDIVKAVNVSFDFSAGDTKVDTLNIGAGVSATIQQTGSWSIDASQAKDVTVTLNSLTTLSASTTVAPSFIGASQSNSVTINTSASTESMTINGSLQNTVSLTAGSDLKSLTLGGGAQATNSVSLAAGSLLDNTTIGSLAMSGNAASFSASYYTKVNTLSLTASRSTVTLGGSARVDTLTSSAPTQLTLSGSASVGSATLSDGAEVSLSNSASVGTLSLAGSGTVTVHSGAVIDKLVLNGDDARVIVKAGAEIKEFIGYANSANDDQLTIEAGAKIGSISYPEGDDRITFAAGTGVTTLTGTLNTGVGDDQVTIKGGTVQLSANRSIDLGAGADRLTLEAGATLQGAYGAGVTTGAGNDILLQKTGSEINLPSGQVQLGEGDDAYTLESGAKLTATRIDLGVGNDTLILAGEAKADVLAGAGADTVLVSGQLTGDVSGGIGADSLTVSGTVTGSVSGDEGNDSITVSGTVTGGVFGGSGADTLVVSGTVRGTLSGDEGSDNVTISSGGKVEGGVQLGEGADYLLVEGTVLGGVGQGSSLFQPNTMGNDTIHVGLSGEVRGGISENDGDDRIIVDGRVVGDVGAGKGNDSITITGNVTGTVFGGAGADTIELYSTAFRGMIEGDGEASKGIGDGDDRIIIGTGAAQNYQDVSVYGGGGNNFITVNDNANLTGLTDGVGNTHLAVSTLGGNDILELRAGSTLTGHVTLGEGDNRLYVGQNATLQGDFDIFSVTTGSGDDTLVLGKDAKLGANVHLGVGSDKTYVYSGASALDPDAPVEVNAGGLGAGNDKLYLERGMKNGNDVLDDAWFASRNYVWDAAGGYYKSLAAFDGKVTINGIRYVDFERIYWIDSSNMPPPPCFFEGTLIRTTTGEKRVEELTEEDQLQGVDGQVLAVKWLGQRRVWRSRLRERDMPVRISRNALGLHTPHMDLYVSSDHAIALGGDLVNAGALVNGHSIQYVKTETLPESFIYFHVETQRHALIWANGAPAETFVDYVSRASFDNFDAYLAAEGAERIIPEMARRRISSQRQLSKALREKLQIEDENDQLNRAFETAAAQLLAF